jgi:ABC-type multidrug transport system ATPase subunit
MTSEDVIIECRELTRRFGSVTAVDRVSFAVRRSSVFGLLGPNGSGKTTLIRMLCGVLQPTSGSARIAGFDVVREREKIQGLIGYMSQQFSLYDELTVEENITFYGRIHALGRQELKNRREELLATMELGENRHKRAHELSGGWRQRLAMSCALVHHPQILFLDEPTAGIDPVARRALWDMLFDLAGRGITLFVTTHYMDEAERCSHVAYIHGGRLVVEGEPDDLKRLPAVNLPGTRRLEVTCDHVTRAMRIIKAQPGVLSATVFGQSMHLLVNDDFSEEEALRKLAEAGITEWDVRQIHPSLEDVFVELTLTSRSQTGERRG